jgi:TonB family protein
MRLLLALAVAAPVALAVAAEPITTPDGLVIVKRVPPQYPARLLQAGIEGCVVVAFAVQPDGRADNIEVLDSVPAGQFDQATFEALNEWRFEPPKRRGRFAQSMHYRIDPKGKGAAKITPVERACRATPSFDALNPRQLELKILSRVMPEYSRDPGHPEGGGCVTLDFEIRPDGTVGKVTVLDAAPGGRYVQETIDAVKQWRFESFEPPALHGQQTFTFDPELLKLPDDAVRGAYATVTGEGAVQNLRCTAGNYGKAKKP